MNLSFFFFYNVLFLNIFRNNPGLPNVTDIIMIVNLFFF